MVARLRMASEGEQQKRVSDRGQCAKRKDKQLGEKAMQRVVNSVKGRAEAGRQCGQG